MQSETERDREAGGQRQRQADSQRQRDRETETAQTFYQITRQTERRDKQTQIQAGRQEYFF